MKKSWGKIYCKKCKKLMGGHFLEEYGEYSDIIDEIYCAKCYKKEEKKNKEYE